MMQRRFEMSLKEAASGHPGGLPNWLAWLFIRFMQFVLALTVCGLYGVDLNRARKANKYADSKWVYAEVVAGLSAFTCTVYLIPFVNLTRSCYFFAWDFILFILWTALFGTFGKMYIHEHAEGNGGITRMKNAVWVDLTNMLLWFITAIHSGLMFRILRKRRSVFPGRAEV